MKTFYANTDLELVSASGVPELISDFKKHSNVMSYVKGDDGNWYANIEASNDNKTIADDDIFSLINIVKMLGSKSLSQWNGCKIRNINIGFECGETWAYQHRLSSDSIMLAASVNSSISVTMYPLESQK